MQPEPTCDEENAKYDDDDSWNDLIDLRLNEKMKKGCFVSSSKYE